MEESTLHIDPREADLIRFISGACSTEESERIYAWISSDTKVLKQYQELVGTMARYDNNYLNEQFNTSKAKDNFFAAIEEHVEEPGKTISLPKSKPRWIMIAASIAILISASLIFLLKPGTIALETHSTPLSEYALPDDSKVWINANSQLHFPKRFGKTRSAELAGEAYFEIESNPENPFLIHTPGAIVRVVGTRLNVRDYPADSTTKVTVAEGKIELLNHKHELMATAKGGESISLNKNTGQAVATPLSNDNYQAWKTGTLKFKDTPLNEAIEQISQYYNTPIQLLDARLAKRKINSAFTNDSLPTVLEILSFMYSVDIDNQDSIIYITASE